MYKNIKVTKTKKEVSDLATSYILSEVSSGVGTSPNITKTNKY